MKAAVFMVWVMGGCGDAGPAEAPVLLETVSQEITFDSVDRLGPHHSISTIQTTEMREREVTLESTQTIEIAWNSWSSFHFQRFVDGDPTFEAINHAGSSASRNRRGPWKGALDGEAARLDVYTAWNAWEEALDGFNNRIVFTESGETVVDGRPAKTYAVSLGPLDPSRAGATAGMLPHRVEGSVTLDSATAVRLRADLLAVSKRKNRVRKIRLNIRRSGIGEVQPIEPPMVPTRSAGDLLKRMPRRPNRP